MLSLEGLKLRAALLQSIRKFFLTRHFLEVDTPVRQPVLIPESNIEPISAGAWFLQSSPEQCMKRLLARGCERIFQLAPCFRAGERGRNHLEEFLLLEWYRTDSDYLVLMEDCRKLVCHVIEELSQNQLFRSIVSRSCFGKMVIDGFWDRLSIREAFSRYCPVELEKALAEDMFDEMIVEYIEPALGILKPLFLFDYPASCASLARKKDEDLQVAERFELYIKGLELANGFSELTDSREQRLRFEHELKAIANGSACSRGMPERFLDDLQLIDTAAGIAFGVDRFLMLIMSADSIDEVVSFSPKDL